MAREDIKFMSIDVSLIWEENENLVIKMII